MQAANAAAALAKAKNTEDALADAVRQRDRAQAIAQEQRAIAVKQRRMAVAAESVARSEKTAAEAARARAIKNLEELRKKVGEK